MFTRPSLRNQRRFADVWRAAARFSATLLWIAGAIGAGAQNQIFVTNTNDSGPGSLRQAIADASPNGDTVITFPGVTGRIGLTRTIVIDRPMTIAGPGADVLSISGNATIQIFSFTNSATNIVVSYLSIVDGGGFSRVLGGGGGMRVFPGVKVQVINCTFSGNATKDPTLSPESRWRWSGGAIFNEGELSLVGCFFSDNSAAGFAPSLSGGPGNGTGGDGGAIYSSGVLRVETCRFKRNTCGNGGSGGGYCSGSAGNGGSGGAIFNAGRATVFASWFGENAAGDGGPGCNGDTFITTAGQGGLGGNGGAIQSVGELFVSNCVFIANRSGSGGDGGKGGPNYFPRHDGARGGNGGNGGALANGGMMSVIGSTLAANSASRGGSGGAGGSGYGMDGANGGSGGNSGLGGGIHNQGQMFALDTILVGNTAAPGAPGGAGGQVNTPPGLPGSAGAPGTDGEGGGIYNTTTNASLRSCEIVANTVAGTNSDVVGTFSSEGNNLVESTAGSTGFGPTDLIGLDPDGDGLPNLAEYAFGTNPRTPTVGARPVGSIEGVGGTNYFALSFQRATNAVGVQCSVVMSDTLSTNGWMLGSRYLGGTAVHERTVEISRQVNGSVETILLRDRLPASSSTNRFMRVDVSVP